VTSRQAWWTVRLTVSDEDARPLSGLGAEQWGFGQGVRALRLGDSTTDADGLTSVTFEVQADSASDAQRRAEELAIQARGFAGLGDAAMPVAWVAPLKDDYASSQRFLDEAGELLEAEHYELAVVAAQIHFELQVRTLFARAVRARSQKWAHRLAEARGSATLSTKQSQATVELLLGVDPTSLPEWPAFTAHLQRRNDVVHGGQAIERDDAAASLRVVRQLWVELAEHARANGVI
jgi:hypothetical protein